MKYAILAALLCSCSTDIVVFDHVTKYGVLEYKTIKVKNRDIVSEKRVLETRIDSYTFNETGVHCTYSGYCFGCGMKFDGKMGCGLGFRASCSGHQDRTTTVAPIIYHTEYELTDGGVIRAASLRDEVRTYVNNSACK